MPIVTGIYFYKLVFMSPRKMIYFRRVNIYIRNMLISLIEGHSRTKLVLFRRGSRHLRLMQDERHQMRQQNPAKVATLALNVNIPG